MLGLGAGIDYALLIVGRYREQLAAGTASRTPRVANATAGTSVVAAGAIVVVAVAGLLATGIPFVGRMGVGSAIIIASVAVGAVTVLPTLMGAFARRLRPKQPETSSRRRLRALGRPDHGRPRAAAVAGTLVLVLLALPFSACASACPTTATTAGSTTRIAYDRLAEGFGPGFNGPLVLAAEQRRRPRHARQGAPPSPTTPASPSSPRPRSRRSSDAAVLTVIPKSSPAGRGRPRSSPASESRRRSDVHVGGAMATLQDLADKIAGRLPIFIAMVVGLSVLLLMAVFRSIWVPLVSAAFNLLSIAAAYGVVVLVFQTGMGVPIVSFVPLFMFAILFGLSMDYNVFLQSRIREEYLRGGPPESRCARWRASARSSSPRA